jgi:hypothetical protein
MLAYLELSVWAAQQSVFGRNSLFFRDSASLEQENSFTLMFWSFTFREKSAGKTRQNRHKRFSW